MSSGATIIARYDAAKRTAAQQTLRRLVRTQGVALFLLAALFSLMVLLPLGFLAADIGLDTALLAAMTAALILPVAVGALGIRQLRRRVILPEIDVMITPEAVNFPAIDRPSALAARIRAESWPREATSAHLLPASGLSVARVEFTRHDGGRRRRRSVAANNLDIDPGVIVDALKAPSI
ncbi:hypothetical protein Q9R20_11645 [Microbacterium sp. PRF11]|uniref:hypothetical protein n=1 Tax=Microbacterium sp. PRF11 TaxID=2962593 RepID=UPI002880C7FC|nr:hypothetical protein [Microbacterium sp. PRF11]MDT0117641.1 hypothetical protein [Microbacterium sp. PRF11]